MKSLLSKQDRRQLEFLELLMEHAYIPLTQVGAHIDYPIRTLSADIKQINGYIAPASVETAREGLHLSIPPRLSVRYLYAQLLQRSREYQLLIYLFFHEGNSQEDIAEDLFLSVSTLRRMVATLNKSLAERGITISTAPYMITGNESEVSLLFISIFSEMYPQLDGLMRPGERTLLLTLCQSLSAYTHIKFHYADLLRTCIWVYVRLTRIAHGHHVDFSQEEMQQHAFPILSDDVYCSAFEAEFGLPLTNALFFELFRLFLRFGYAYAYQDIARIAAQSEPHRALHACIEQLLLSVSAPLGLHHEGTQSLVLDLFNILQFSDRPANVLYHRSSIFVKGFTRENRLTASIINDAIRHAFGAQAERAEVSDMIFYLLVTHWPDLIRKIREGMPEISVGVLFDSDVEHAQFFADLTEQVSRLRLRLIVPEPSHIDALDSICHGLDLLITNVPNLSVPCCDVICIEDYPTLLDKERIVVETERIYLKKWRQGSDAAPPNAT